MPFIVCKNYGLSNKRKRSQLESFAELEAASKNSDFGSQPGGKAQFIPYK